MLKFVPKTCALSVECVCNSVNQLTVDRSNFLRKWPVSVVSGPVTPPASVTAVSGVRRSCSDADSAGLRSTATGRVSAPPGKNTSKSVLLSRATAKCPMKTSGRSLNTPPRSSYDACQMRSNDSLNASHINAGVFRCIFAVFRHCPRSLHSTVMKYLIWT